MRGGLRLALLICVTAAWGAGCGPLFRPDVSPRPPAPAPGPTNTLRDRSAEVSRAAGVEVNQLWADVWERAAERCRETPPPTDKQLGDQLADGLKAAREKAFAPVDTLLNEAIVDGKWSAKQAELIYRGIADGHRRVQ